jgi:hypothetical protein|tara:strand:- start:6 stop:431 length:426 start_codon:yes stop_codon:yes gene_type:complete
MKLLNKYPMIKLDNGLNVVNYSSPHPYTFDTGEVLPMCTKEVSSTTMLKEDHEVIDSPIRGIAVKDVFINFSLQPFMTHELVKLSLMSAVDIILVPYPVLNALKKGISGSWPKIRTCRTTDRFTKVISSTQFCAYKKKEND